MRRDRTRRVSGSGGVELSGWCDGVYETDRFGHFERPSAAVATAAAAAASTSATAAAIRDAAIRDASIRACDDTLPQRWQVDDTHFEKWPTPERSPQWWWQWWRKLDLRYQHHKPSPSVEQRPRRRSRRAGAPSTTFTVASSTHALLFISMLLLLLASCGFLTSTSAQSASPDWTFSEPAQFGGYQLKFPWTFTYNLPAEAVPGSVQMTLTQIDAGDGHGDREYTFATANEAAGGHTALIGQPSSPGSSIASVTPTNDLPNGVSVLVFFQYTKADDGSGPYTPAYDNLNIVITFDTVTITPTFSVVSSGGKVPTNFQFSFEIFEKALAGSVKLVITPTNGGVADNNGVRTVVLSSSNEVIQAKTMTLSRLQTAASLTDVASVAPDVNLVNGAEYTMHFEYQDTKGNVAAQSSGVTGLILDQNTETPNLIAPSQNGIASIPTNFVLQYTLPEQAAAGTVKLTITPTAYGGSPVDVCSTQGDSAVTRFFTLIPARGTQGSHSVTFSALSSASSLSDVASMIPSNMCDLNHGTVYDFQLSYQDAALNDVASDSQIVTFDAFAQAITLSAPNGSSTLSPRFDVTFSLLEEANPGTVALVFSYTGGTATDGLGDRTITFVNTVYQAQEHSVSLVTLSTLAASEALVDTVSPSDDLLDKAEYSLKVIYSDKAGNSGESNLLEDIAIDSSTDAPTLSEPSDNAFVPTSITLTYTVPEAADPGSLLLRFHVVSSTVDLGDGLDYFEYHQVTLGGETTPTTGSKTITLPALSAAVAGLAEVSAVSVYPSSGIETSSDIDLVHGALYNVTLLYSDQQGNPQASDTASLIEFSGSVTATPTLTSPSAGAALKTAFNIQFTLPEPALKTASGGDMKLDVVTTTSALDSVALRSISFAQSSAAVERGSHSIAVGAGGLGTVASDALVAAISDTTALVDGADYEFRLSYEDRAGNPSATATSAVSFHGDATLSPTINHPQAGSCLTTTFRLDFTLPENALSGSLKMTMTQNSGSKRDDGAAARVLTFSDLVLARGSHEIASGNMQALSTVSGLSQVTSVAPATDLVDGVVYDMVLKYKDAANNAEVAVNFPGGGAFYFGGTTTQQHGMVLGGGVYTPASTGSVALGGNWQVGVWLPERALAGSVQLKIARSDGVEDPNSPHIITFGSDLEVQSDDVSGIGDADKHTLVGISALSGLVGTVPSTQVVSVTSNGGTAANMQDGSLYRFTLTYQDCAGNTAPSVVRNLVAFAGSSTITPDLAVPVLIASPFTVTMQTNERAQTGTFQLIIGYAGGFSDSVATRIITFADSLLEPSLYTISVTPLSGLADQLTTVTSVSPATDLVDGAEYNFVLSMQDAAGNDAAVDIVNGVYFAGSVTRTPSITTPVQNSVTVQSFPITIVIAERAAAGTVKLVFTPTGGTEDNSGARTVTLTSAFEAFGTHTFTMGRLSLAAAAQSEVSSVSPAVDLVHMAVYSITVEYQDLLSNPKAEATIMGITHDVLTESMDLVLPSGGSAIQTTFTLQYNLGEAALAGSLKLTIAYVSGITDSNGDRIVILNADSVGDAAGSQSFSLTALSGVTSLDQISSVNTAIDLVDGATYNMNLEYQDLQGNTKQERTQAGVVFAAAATLPAIMTKPSANIKVPQDFQVRYEIPEQSLANTLRLVIAYAGTGTNDPNAAREISFISSMSTVGVHVVTLNAISKLLLKVPETTSVSPTADLINGANYDVSIVYQDRAGNNAATSTVTNIEFDIVTDPPFIDGPASGNIKEEFTLTLRTTEDAMAGTMRVEIRPTSGDSAAIRVINFASVLDTAGTHSLAMADLDELVSGNTNITSVTPATNLVHMAEYIVTFVYRDAIENTEATSNSLVMIHDRYTENPSLALPATNTRFKAAFLIDFTLPEHALSDSVKMTFTRTNGTADSAADRVVVFAANYRTAGQHNDDEPMVRLSSAASSVSFVKSVTPATDLVHMAQYTVVISYQDTAANTPAIATTTGAIFDTVTETPTLVSPADNSYPVEAFTMSFTLPEDAMSQSVILNILPIAGGQFNDNLGGRQIIFSSSVESAGTYSFTMASLTTIVDDVPEVRTFLSEFFYFPFVCVCVCVCDCYFTCMY